MRFIDKMKKILLLYILIVTISLFPSVMGCAYDTTLNYLPPQIADVIFEEQGKILHDGDVLHVSVKIVNKENCYSVPMPSFESDAFDGKKYNNSIYLTSCKYNADIDRYEYTSAPLTENLAEINYYLFFPVHDKIGNTQYIYFNKQYNFVYSNNCYNGIHTGGTATCKSKARCIVCNREYGNIGTHSYSTTYTTDKLATLFSAGQESLRCKVCGVAKPNSQRSIAKLTGKVTLNATTTTLQLKKASTALKVTSLSNGDSVLKWESSNPKVVSVNSKTGKITGKKTGNATITVTTQSGATAKCRVKVQKGVVKTTKIAFTKKSVNLKKGQKLQLEFNRKPVTANDKLTYTSSNKKIVSVTSKGKITAKKKGTATITVKAKSGKKTKCKITVK